MMLAISFLASAIFFAKYMKKTFTETQEYRDICARGEARRAARRAEESAREEARAQRISIFAQMAAGAGVAVAIEEFKKREVAP